MFAVGIGGEKHESIGDYESSHMRSIKHLKAKTVGKETPQMCDGCSNLNSEMSVSKCTID